MNGSLAVKAPFRDRNLSLMADTLRRHGDALAAAKIDLAGFERLAWREVVDGAAAAYRFALGRAPTPAQAAELSGLLAAQRAHFDRFLADIRAAEQLGFVPNRASMYRAAGVQADSAGKVAGLPDDAVIKWVGPDGPDACADCLSHIGSYTAADFRAMTARPGSVQCLGRCRCHLEGVD